ncbi:MAG TPA: hypothetical protein VHX63_11800 [Acidobacteriaceae bacterium]|jgi:hypothetical protein|nr:hypothetical protein [Acidobacteriaceae bacterium]
MKTYFIIAVMATCLGLASAQQLLTNDSVVKMVKAGISDGIIVSTINSQPANFILSSTDLIALKQAGVSDQVMAAMIAKNNHAAATTPAPSLSANAVPSGMVMLREGSDVPLQFAQSLSSKSAAEGDPVVFTLAEDLKVENVVVAKAGSKAFGEVTNAKKSGMMGKAGELNVRLDYLKVGDSRVKLRGTKGKEGESGVTGTVVLTVLFGPIGLIKHGKNINIPQGAPLKAYVADDIPLPPAPSLAPTQ